MIIDIGAGNNNVNFHKGGGAAVKVEDSKQVTYTANGTFEIAPSDGYDAIKGAEVKVEVSEPSTVIDLSTGIKFGGSVFTVCPFRLTGASGKSGCASLFKECSYLKTIDVSGIDAAEAESLELMFSNSTQLTNVNFGNISTSNVITINNIFNGCYKLISVDFSNLDFGKLRYMQFIFNNCYALTSVDFTGVAMTNLMSMTNAFSGCSSLSVIRLSSSFFSSSILTTYDFSGATAWTEETSLATLVDALPQLTSSKTIKLSTATKNALTDEQKTTITDKGWTIA